MIRGWMSLWMHRDDRANPGTDEMNVTENEKGDGIGGVGSK